MEKNGRILLGAVLRAFAQLRYKQLRARARMCFGKTAPAIGKGRLLSRISV